MLEREKECVLERERERKREEDLKRKSEWGSKMLSTVIMWR